jgi:transcriptional regulator with XRE-family HTH domain
LRLTGARDYCKLSAMADSTLAERLKEAREARGLGSVELSLKVGSHALVSSIEQGKTENLKADTAIKLARELNVPVEWLVLGEGKSGLPKRGSK